eukprot:SAG11_NODE_20257_length_449_cov_1.060000_1_plen_90_part_10
MGDTRLVGQAGEEGRRGKQGGAGLRRSKGGGAQQAEQVGRGGVGEARAVTRASPSASLIASLRSHHHTPNGGAEHRPKGVSRHGERGTHL